MKVLERRFLSDLLDGNVSALGAELRLPRAELREGTPFRQVIAENALAGSCYLAAATSLSIPLPDGYTDADDLMVLIRATGDIEVSATSPEALASKTYQDGATTRPAVYFCTQRITTLSVLNVSAVDAITVSYVLVHLPDISDEDSFRNLQSTGARVS